MCWGVGELVDRKLARQLVHVNKSGMRNALDRTDWEAVPASVFNEQQLEGIIRAVNREPLLMVSAAPDKSRVGSIGLSSAPFVLPSGIAWWGPPQDRAATPSEHPILITSLTKHSH